MCTWQSPLVAPLIDTASDPKGRKQLWNDALEISFKGLKRVVYVMTLLSYPFWKLTFTVHTDTSDKQLGAFISHNNKPIAVFSRRLIKPHPNYTTTEKELLAVVECLKQLRGTLFG